MRLQGAFDLSRCTPHERHDRTFVARRTHRNGEPPFGTHEHKNHPNLRQNHRPEDKPRHGNPVAQVGKKEALPGMTGTESLEASSEGKEIRELRENSEETVSLGYQRRKKSNFIDS